LTSPRVWFLNTTSSSHLRHKCADAYMATISTCVDAMPSQLPQCTADMQAKQSELKKRIPSRNHTTIDPQPHCNATANSRYLRLTPKSTSPLACISDWLPIMTIQLQTHPKHTTAMFTKQPLPALDAKINVPSTLHQRVTTQHLRAQATPQLRTANNPHLRLTPKSTSPPPCISGSPPSTSERKQHHN
jgi:hypothetical protein